MTTKPLPQTAFGITLDESVLGDGQRHDNVCLTATFQEEHDRWELTLMAICPCCDQPTTDRGCSFYDDELQMPLDNARRMLLYPDADCWLCRTAKDGTIATLEAALRTQGDLVSAIATLLRGPGFQMIPVLNLDVELQADITLTNRGFMMVDDLTNRGEIIAPKWLQDGSVDSCNTLSQICLTFGVEKIFHNGLHAFRTSDLLGCLKPQSTTDRWRDLLLKLTAHKPLMKS